MKPLVALTIGSVVATSMIPKVNAEAIVDDTIVTLGESLSASQRDWVLERVEAPAGIEPIITTVADEEKYLGDAVPQAQRGGGMYSSARIKLTDGTGLDIKTENVTWVTEDMYANALVTAGVTDADIYITSPIRVTGTSALTGIMKAYDQTAAETGIQLSEERKDLAQEELAVTSEIGKTVGQEDVAGLMNEIKAEIANKAPETNIEIRDIVIQVLNQNNVQLSDTQLTQLTTLFENMQQANLDWGAISNGLQGAGQDVQAFLETEEVQGFFARLFEALSNFFKSLTN
ncbi:MULTISPECIES: DUF1002 domain-containing protein [Exiguobacterium]|jgi:uncharacterized protein YpuA (DUF1002 family)|uniref:DUF1002 domain-containing protein n=1 Tax=Exiguobacterium TaxID=33986 RepID=UPI00049746B3|nr:MULTISPECIES: DUF1002 domain-containing protein [Exiguobacterium]MCT4776886.1 DUF1002 domain-containing protein [Exiguobacterium aquaticum]MCT4788253.1 DUF1002 domain-containing protein [Exiguobacterium mexicanum]TCI72699.1 DUF1002 domain-containing protein [Exiguobacterium sp. IPCI3]TCI82221.1 DUF1002 domain-containing protein [Exiguobacterium sp. IPCH1]TCI83727.1 DUF1002 domain-containing protein [Exiguobacterium sp. IPBC4]